MAGGFLLICFEDYIFHQLCHWAFTVKNPLVTSKSRSYRETWWRHQMETISALLAYCAESLPVTGELPSQRPVTRSFYVVFYLSLNKRLSKQSWGWWFELPSRSLWRHCNVTQSWFHCYFSWDVLHILTRPKHYLYPSDIFAIYSSSHSLSGYNPDGEHKSTRDFR